MPADGGEYGPPAGEYVSTAKQDRACRTSCRSEGEVFRPEAYGAPADLPPPTYSPWLTRLGFRHSYTHGRNVGWGGPLVGTSWLNRPYYFGATLGPMWMTRRVEDSVGRDVDVIGSVFFGWDWDYYWGSEFQYAYATPELINSTEPDAPRGDRMVHLELQPDVLSLGRLGDSALLAAGRRRHEVRFPYGRWQPP